MNFSQIDQPLGQDFYMNPYEFLQTFVRNMNNEVFLSQYQLNHLYALLLLKKKSPWDQVKPNHQNMKNTIQQIVNQKLCQVKKILQGLSQVYQNRVKKSTFGQIQKLMNIIKANNKSIFIEKDIQFSDKQHKKLKQQRRLQKQIKSKLQQQNFSLLNLQQKPTNSNQIISINNQNIVEIIEQNNVKKQQHKKQKQTYKQKQKQKQDQQQDQFNESNGDDKQVLSLFYGLTNLPNLSTLALSNCLEFSSSERYIKFKMSTNYIMTIKNEDQQYFDRQSTLKNVSSEVFTNHLFPYLTAVELFKSRAVCRQWMDNVKQAWHSTFKRQMFVQLMACQFCKQIQYYYKLIQLRNPFFQKISLLMHALLQIIQWDKVVQSIQNNTIILLQKRVLIILLKLIGEQINITNPNSITEQIWNQNKQKLLTIKQRISLFLNNMSSTILSVNQLIQIKINLLDDPFIRIEEVNSEDKTPLLLVIFIKQMTLQQILKNHIFFSQQYLMNTKKRLDNVSSKMPQQKGFLEGVYKILLLRNLSPNMMNNDSQQGKSQMPNFQQLLSSIFSQSQQSKPDFVIRNKSSSTNIFLDKATKLDIIMSTVRKIKYSTDDLQQEQNQKLQQNKQSKQLNNLVQQQNKQPKQQNKYPRKQLKRVNIYNINLNITNTKKKNNKCDFQQNIYEKEINQQQQKFNQKGQDQK